MRYIKLIINIKMKQFLEKFKKPDKDDEYAKMEDEE